LLGLQMVYRLNYYKQGNRLLPRNPGYRWRTLVSGSLFAD
jgi:hypothetical protein